MAYINLPFIENEGQRYQSIHLYYCAISSGLSQFLWYLTTALVQSKHNYKSKLCIKHFVSNIALFKILLYIPFNTTSKILTPNKGKNRI